MTNHLDIAKKEGRERFDRCVFDPMLHTKNGKTYIPIEQARDLFDYTIKDHERAIEIALLEDLVEELKSMSGTDSKDTDESQQKFDKIWNGQIGFIITKYQDRINKLTI